MQNSNNKSKTFQPKILISDGENDKEKKEKQLFTPVKVVEQNLTIVTPQIIPFIPTFNIPKRNLEFPFMVEPKRPKPEILNQRKIFISDETSPAEEKIDISEFTSLLENSSDAEVKLLIKNKYLVKIFFHGHLDQSVKLIVSYKIQGLYGPPTKIMELPIIQNYAVMSLNLLSDRTFVEHSKTYQKKVFQFVFKVKNFEVITPKFKIVGLRGSKINSELKPETQSTQEIPKKDESNVQIEMIVPESIFTFGGQFVKLYFKCHQEHVSLVDPQILLKDVPITIWYFGVDKMDPSKNLILFETPKIEIDSEFEKAELTLLDKKVEIGKISILLSKFWLFSTLSKFMEIQQTSKKLKFLKMLKMMK
jgi:hypothetical protein